MITYDCCDPAEGLSEQLLFSSTFRRCEKELRNIKREQETLLANVQAWHWPSPFTSAIITLTAIITVIEYIESAAVVAVVLLPGPAGWGGPW